MKAAANLAPQSAEMAGGKADVIEFPSQNEKGFFEEDVAAQQAALEALPRYPVAVVRRRAFKDPEVSRAGTFYQESVRYTDGAVRLVTIGIPHAPKSPYVLSSGDPWLTGSKGFNQIEIEQLVANGFPVVWNHHHGRHAAMPTNRERLATMLHFMSSKSLAKSAAHDHALLDDLEPYAAFDTRTVIRKGFSRSGMTGEAFIAQCALDEVGRETVWSDLEAVCFAKGVGTLALLRILAKQGPREARALLDITASVVRKTPATAGGKPVSIQQYLGTFDSHPLNVAHEIPWIKLLTCGDTGVYAEAIPLDARGVRTTYEDDLMSQPEEQRLVHSKRKNISFLSFPGAHIWGASPEMLAVKDLRYQNLGRYIVEHNADMSGLTLDDLQPKLARRQQKLATAA